MLYTHWLLPNDYDCISYFVFFFLLPFYYILFYFTIPCSFLCILQLLSLYICVPLWLHVPWLSLGSSCLVLGGVPNIFTAGSMALVPPLGARGPPAASLTSGLLFTQCHVAGSFRVT